MKDFNLVKFLKTNKLGSYGMINENYMDLPAVNNYSEQHPIHNISEEDFDGDENEAPMDAISRAEGIVDENQLNKFRMAAMALIGDMENDGFETEEAIDVLKQIIDAQMGKETNSGLNKDDSATVDQYLDMISKDQQFDKKSGNYAGLLIVDPSDSGEFTDIAMDIAKNPAKYASELYRYNLKVAPGSSAEEMVFLRKKGLNESEIAYVVRNGKCYKKDDEGNSSEVSYIECKRRGIY